MTAKVGKPESPCPALVEFNHELKDQDPVWADETTLADYEELVEGKAQPLDCVPDHYFPQEASKVGMVRWIPQTVGELVIQGSRGPRCWESKCTLHKNCAPAFVYT